MTDVEADGKNLISVPTTPISIGDEEPFLVKPIKLKFTKKSVWYKRYPPPIASLIISIIQIIVYFAATKNQLKWLYYDPNRQEEAWRFVTYMFVHSTLVHIILNVLIQCLFAFSLEKNQGSLRVVVLYFGGGAIGALSASCLRPDLVVGASAGVYALLISHISHIILNYHSTKYKVAALLTVATIVSSDVIYNFVHVYYNGEPIISEGAHVGGAIGGFLLGLLIYKSKDKDVKIRRLITFWGAFIIFSFVIISLIFVTYQIKKCNKGARIRTHYVYVC